MINMLILLFSQKTRIKWVHLLTFLTNNFR